MRCCTPETVTVTVSGFSGSIIPSWTVHDVAEFTFQGVKQWDAHRELPWIGAHSAMYEKSGYGGECLPINQTSDQLWEDVQLRDPDLGSLFLDTCGQLWSSIAFPPKMPTCDGMVGYGVDIEDKCTCYVGRTKWQRTDDFKTDPSFTVGCVDILCQQPGESWHYGPVGRGDRVCEEDINGSWVTHRIDSGLRPELIANVIRSQEVPEGTPAARLRYDVYCRRHWSFDADCQGVIITQLHCNTTEPPVTGEPDGKWYCVDYYCGPRNMGPEEDGSSSCDQYQCTAEEGYVWPHLVAWNDGNNSASLRLALEPADWYGPDYSAVPANTPIELSQVPYSWKVSSVEINDPGYGYSVGDFFLVDFDPDWMVSLNGFPPLSGQVVIGFPEQEPVCGLSVEFVDDYGATKHTLPGWSTPDIVAERQRIRVSEVDEDGGITAVEFVPWYSSPEYRPGQCIDTINDKAHKTKFWPSYTRWLCHPRSVDIAGEGYRVGDQIEWFCTDPACVTETPAVAYVTDVDDKGGVLDWRIRGSDICMYGKGGYVCYDPEGRPDCAADQYGNADDRGAYKFDGKRLCELQWSGTGNPVRAADRAQMLSQQDYLANLGTLTSVQITTV